jgi:hypothetical protein
MKCSVCNSDMLIAGGSEPVPGKNPGSVFYALKMVCVNPKCSEYAGLDLNNPLKHTTEKRPANNAAAEEMKASGTA